MEDIIRLEHISKEYDQRVVLQDVTFSIGIKEIVALIGANGSGKSTLLRIICGLIRPSSGKIHNNLAKETKISYVPERFPKLRLTTQEYLLSMGKIQGLHKKFMNRRVKELMDQFGLTEVRDRRMNFFSKGMLQKVNIMQAVLSQPDLLVLDEPLSGLDATSQQDLLGLLQEMKQQDISMIMTCHESVLLDELANRTISLQQGRVQLHSIQGQKSYVTIHFKLPSNVSTFDIGQIGGVPNLEKVDGAYRLQVESEFSDEALLMILNCNGSIWSVTPTEYKEWIISESITIAGEVE
ncbi:ABC transporter ATP-binding protein [Paenibacillus antarcticus]|uniref:ABC transporter domain-containing protein n=1 Tax=Paenibacillus antarcticus TaxID=253703 RepID=A0A168QL70_9BACL|nr:ABC transporter ATP-binding protein [Paenibacillus antarcticus]OAB47912.1 hypothetical protein PBAT_03300 [Paenibacillus antarcticus]